MSDAAAKPFRNDCFRMGCHSAQVCLQQEGECCVYPHHSAVSCLSSATRLYDAFAAYDDGEGV